MTLRDCCVTEAFAPTNTNHNAKVPTWVENAIFNHLNMAPCRQIGKLMATDKGSSQITDVRRLLMIFSSMQSVNHSAQSQNTVVWQDTKPYI